MNVPAVVIFTLYGEDWPGNFFSDYFWVVIRVFF